MSIHLYAAAMTLLLCILPVAAQSAYFRGVTETLPGSYTNPSGIAVDGKGNLYVADAGANTVSEILASNSSQVTLASGFNFPLGLALDSSGNVYVADYHTGNVDEILASNDTVVTLATGYAGPQGVAVDSSGDVYFADAHDNSVYEILAVDGSIPASPTINLVGGGFSSPEGLAADSKGNIYIADVGNSAVKEMTPGCSSTACVTTLASGLNTPEGVAVDNSGDVYFSTVGANSLQIILAVDGSIPASPTIISLGSGFNHPIGVAVDGAGDVFVANYSGPSVFKVITAGVNFGTVSIGTSSPPSFTIPFTFTAGGTIKAPVVLTLGATGLDFTDTGSGTCTTNGTSYAYVSGNTCTVTVQFAPKAPGLRLGAVQIEDSSGNPIATARLYGTGSGPQAVFPSNSTPAVVGSGFSYPNSVAVDGNDDVFVADNGSGDVAVKEIVAVGGLVSSSSTVNAVGSGFSTPFGVAVDGSGDVFVADYGSGAVDEIIAVNGLVSSSSTVVAVGSGFSKPTGVAVDGNGDVFVADYGHNAVKEILASGGQVSSSSTVVAVGSGFSEPWGVAVDGSGDVFVGDQGNNAVKEIVAVHGLVSSSSTVNTVGSGFNQPADVAVDASGDVFVADLDNNAVKEIVAASGLVSSSSTVVTLGSGFSMPLGVAVDANGNVFVADAGNSSVKEIPLATPPTIAFPTVTQEGTTDTVDGPLSATVANNGNTTLTFNLTGGDNPSVPTNFAWDDSSTCNQTNGSSSTAFTLDEGASCTVAVDFAPTTAGSPLTGNVTLTDNSLNATAATQQIPLSGTAVDITMTPAANTALPSGSVGTAYSGTTFAASGGSGTYTYSATGLPAGLTLDSSSGALSGTPTAVANSASVTVTATDSSSSVQIGQNYTITISQGTVTLSWTPPSSITYGTSLSTVLTATASVGGTTEPPSFGTATYTASLNPSGTPVTVTSLTVLDAGAYTLTLSYTPSDTTDYTTPAQIQETLTVNQATATISINNIPSSPVYSGSFTPAYTYSGNGTPTESVSSTTLSVCTVTGGTVNFVGVGTCTLTAAATATTDYAAATGTPQTFTVGQATATIGINNIPSSPVYSGSFTPAYTYSGNGSPTESVSSTTLSVCTVTGGVVNFVGVGTCTLTAAATATTDYLAATGSQQSFTVNQATQTITFTPPASPVTFGVSPITLSATSTSGQTVTFTIDAASTATGSISGDTLTVTGAGTLIIDANQSGDSDYQAATQVQQTILVNPAAQIITFTPPTSPVTFGVSPIALSASSTSGLTVMFTIDPSSTAAGNITGDTLTINSAGTLVIDANQPGNADYQPAAQVQNTIVVNPANFVVTASSDDAGTAANCTPQTTPGTGSDSSCSLRDALLEAAATGGGNISFDATKFGAATTITLANGTLTLPSAATITGPTTGSGASLVNLVTVDGNGASAVFTVSSGVTGASIANLTIQHGNNAGIQNAGALTLTGDSIASNTASGAGGGINNSGTLVLGSSTISGNTAGGNGGGVSNSGSLTLSDDTIANNSASGSAGGINNSATLVVSDSTLSGNTAATASSGGGIDNTGSGTVALANSVLSGNSANSAADDFDGAAYTDNGGNVAGVVNGATVNASAIDLAPLGSYGGPTQTVVPLPGSPAICAGLAASIPSGLSTDERGLPNTNTSYPNYSTCVDAGAVQTNYALSFSTQPAGAAVGANFAAGVTLTESGNPFAPSVTIPLTLTGAGALSGGSAATSSGVASYTLQVNTVGTGDALTANLTLNGTATPAVAISTTSDPFNIGIATTTVTLSLSSSSITYGTQETLTATLPSAATGSVTFYDNGTIALGTGTVNAGTASFSSSTLTAGSYSITAAYSGDSNYSPETSSAQTFTVGQATATIGVNNIPSSPVYNGSFTPAYTYSGNGSPTESVSSTTPGVCTVSSGVVNFGGVGTCTLTAAATATTDYAAATGTPQSFTVGQATATIGVNNIPSSPVYNGSFTPAYTYSGNGSPTESVSSTTLSVCTVTGGTVNFVGVGTCTLTAAATATTDYAAATGTPQSFTVGQATATIGVSNIPASPVYNGSFTPAYAYSGNGSPTESVSSTTPGVCTVSSGVVNFGGVGTCTLTAAATATTDYAAATGTPQSFTVGQATLTVAANNATRVYGVANPVFTGSVIGAVNGDTFTESFLTSATIASNVETYSIVPTAAGANLADYTVTVQNGTLTITQAGTTTSLNVSSGSITPGQSATLTAQVASSTTGTPTGSVNFYDGAALLDTATLAGGTASFATTTLSAGITHRLTAVYSGDVNFATSSTSSSTPIVVAPLDFSLTPVAPIGQTVNPGAHATYEVVVAPLYGTYAGPVTFTVTGLPSDAVATFAPPSIPANGGQQTVTMTIQTAATTGALQPAPETGRTKMPLALAFLLLPLLGVRRLRRQGQRLSRVLCLLLLLLSGAATIVLGGCGGHPKSSQSPATYTLTVTASSANLQHSTTFNLTVAAELP
jgi:sugar lactone lactonase YvrE